MERDAPLPVQLNAREKEILARLAAGLSDQQIAADLFLSPNTVRWYNRQIYTKLGVGSRTQAVSYAQDRGLLGRTAASAPRAPKAVLPLQSSPLIGRSREIMEVKQLLQRSRLLTLTGMGGMGKTRLALCVASALCADSTEGFPDGVYFVDLAPVNDAALVANAIATALDIFPHPQEPLVETLQRALAGRALLLLIDNFEHVITAAPLVAPLLAASPHLKVLVTSREALRISGEQEYQVPPLSLPSAEIATVQEVAASEAGALFVQRTQMMQPHFVLTADNAAAIAQLCTRLDGLPLAIELAAARCKVLSPQALLDRLDNRLNLLTHGARDAPARQRTLRNTLEWSYNLLDQNERTLLARLAVFRGGCALEAAEAVCCQDLSLEVLASLVDKSLVHQYETAEGHLRFGLLETIHEFAREQLQASDEIASIRSLHAGYFVALAEHAEPELRRARQKEWFRLLEVEIDNLRAALAWSLAGGDLALGIQILSSTFLYWYICGRQDEGIRWAQQQIARMDEVEPAYQLRLLRYAAHLISYRDSATALDLSRQALRIARDDGDKGQLGWALYTLGARLMDEPFTEIMAEAHAIFQELDEQLGLAHLLNISGEYARLHGDDEQAGCAYAEALALAERMGDIRLQYVALYNNAFIAQHKGDHPEAIRLLRRSLALCKDTGIPAEVARELLALAGSFGAMGELGQAARLFGAAEVLLERSGALVHPDDQPEHDRNIAFVRDQLGDEAFHAALAAGRQLTMEQAVASVYT